MALVKGPLFSLEAAGQVGKAIVFSKWKGRAYVRQHVVPSNPESGAQVGRRAMFKFLAQSWAALSTADKATWEELAAAETISPFNAYIAVNMGRWHNFLGPGTAYPVPGTGSDSDYALTAAAWEENRIKLSISGTDPADAWGFVTHAYLSTGADLTVANVIVAIFHPVAPYVYYWTPPSVATWYFDTMAFTEDGKKATAGGEQSAAP